MSSLVLGSRLSRRTDHRRAARSRMRHRLRLGIELLEDRITPAVPTVTGVLPSSGPVGTPVSVSGTNFTNAFAIYFGNIEATQATIVSATLITAVSPTGSGTVDVTVQNDDGKSALNPPNDQYTYTTTTAPTVTGLSPDTGPLAGGTSVTITGTGFAAGSTVAFGAVSATNVMFNSATSLSATSPPGSSVGAVDVRVTTAGVTSPINQPADLFTYTSTTAPTVTGLSPNTGPLAGGTSVTITGTGFAAGSTVAFGTVSATNVIFNSATSLSVTSPPGSSVGAVDVRVTTAGFTSPINQPADLFTYTSTTAPTVTGLSPTFGPAAGGTFVTVSGTNFSNLTAVDFGAVPGTGATVKNSSTITVFSPAGSGIVDVTVTTSAGTSPINQPADQFTYVAAPTVTSVSPPSGPLAGGTLVTITGTDLLGASAVYFGTTPATSFDVSSTTSITAMSPPGTSPGAVDVTVTTPAGTSPPNPPFDQFTYLAAPAVLGISPSSGPTAGGTSVTITGTNFTGASSVLFGTTPAASFIVVSGATITAVSPPGTGAVDVIVTAPGGTSAASPADQFTYVAAPTVTAISPTSGPVSGGTLVTITGTGFSQPDDPVSVYFGSTAATDVMVVSASLITAVSPPGSGSVNVTVSAAGGISPTSPADVFTYTSTNDGPRVTSVVRYGYHAQPTYFVIYFNMPLNRASAQLASNYSIVAWQIVGLIGQPFPIKSATYNAKTDSVTLAFPRRLILRKNYTLTINGTTASGVKNINGALLDGANTGQPGSNYVATISQNNLAGSASQRPVADSLRAKVKGLMSRVKVGFRRKDVER